MVPIGYWNRRRKMNTNVLMNNDCELADAELENVTGGFWQIALFGAAVAVATIMADSVVSGTAGTKNGPTSTNVGKGQV